MDNDLVKSYEEYNKARESGVSNSERYNLPANFAHKNPGGVNEFLRLIKGKKERNKSLTQAQLNVKNNHIREFRETLFVYCGISLNIFKHRYFKFLGVGIQNIYGLKFEKRVPQ